MSVLRRLALEIACSNLIELQVVPLVFVVRTSFTVAECFAQKVLKKAHDFVA